MFLKKVCPSAKTPCFEVRLTVARQRQCSLAIAPET